MCMRADIQLHTQRRLLWSAASCVDHGWCPTVAISIPIGSLYIQSLLCPCANRVPRLAVTAMLRHSARPLRFPHAHTLPARTATPMFRPLELFIGLRYTRAKRRNHFISFISLVSMLGIAVGVIALITVISVMNGFEKKLRDSILGMAAHATIAALDGGIPDWERVVADAKRDPHVLGAAPNLDSQALLQGARRSGAVVSGILPELQPQVSDIGSNLIKGRLEDLKPGAFGMILGNELAMQLGVGIGDKVSVYTSEINVTPVGGIARFKRFEVVGIFSVGFQEYDEGLALIHLEDAERLFQADGPGGIRLKLDDMFRAWPLTRDLAAQLGRYYRITTWEQGHSNFFKALAMEKLVMFIILSLVIAVAAFNLVSSLVMLVNDKQADIAI